MLPTLLCKSFKRKGGLKDEVVILEAEDDDDLWLNNAESRHLSYFINLAERRVLELEGPILN
ncbi:hypothetical protein V2W45_1414787 [Cenococcum geophilum]